MRNYVGMLKGEIYRMIGAEAASGHGEAWRLIFPSDERKKFMQNVALILQMPHHSHSRMNAFVIPTFHVDGVWTEDLQVAALDFRGEYPDHSSIFVLKKLAHGGRKYQKWGSGMAKNQCIHVTVQFMAVSFEIFTIHAWAAR